MPKERADFLNDFTRWQQALKYTRSTKGETSAMQMNFNIDNNDFERETSQQQFCVNPYLNSIFSHYAQKFERAGVVQKLDLQKDMTAFLVCMDYL